MPLKIDKWRSIVPVLLALVLLAAPLCAPQCDACPSWIFGSPEQGAPSHCEELSQASSSPGLIPERIHTCDPGAMPALLRTKTSDMAALTILLPKHSEEFTPIQLHSSFALCLLALSSSPPLEAGLHPASSLNAVPLRI